MNEWQNSVEQDAALIRLGARAKRDPNGQLTRREALDFRAIFRLVGSKIKDGAQLSEEFLRAKVAQETNTALKMAEEAAELAARREEIEANADYKRQEAAGQFIENLKKIDELPVDLQLIALEKLFASNSEVAAQLDKIEVTVQRLRVVYGLRIEVESQQNQAAIEGAAEESKIE